MNTNINFEVLVRSIGDGVVISDAKGVILNA